MLQKPSTVLYYTVKLCAGFCDSVGYPVGFGQFQMSPAPAAEHTINAGLLSWLISRLSWVVAQKDPHRYPWGLP